MFGTDNGAELAGIVMLLIGLNIARLFAADMLHRWKNRNRTFIGRHWGVQGRTPHRNF